MEFIFCMQINIKVLYKLALSFLMGAGRHVQSTQSRKLVKFLKYIKKKCVATAFVFYGEAKNFDVYMAPVMFVVTCLYFNWLKIKKKNRGF